MPRPEPVYLEMGKKWVFACSLAWPGWCRRGRDEEVALETLLAYAPRYRSVVGGGFSPGDLDVVGRVEGSATTDFGAPGSVGPGDDEPLRPKELDRHLSALEAAWRAFDRVVAPAPPELRKGPRGGGRNRDQIADHVRDAERAYASRLGVRVPPRTPWPEQRVTLVTAMRTSGSSGKWPLRYGIRRVAWHLLDHAWEIQDRSP